MSFSKIDCLLECVNNAAEVVLDEQIIGGVIRNWIMENGSEFVDSGSDDDVQLEEFPDGDIVTMVQLSHITATYKDNLYMQMLVLVICNIVESIESDNQ